MTPKNPQTSQEVGDTDRLAALLHEEMRFRIGIEDPHPEDIDVDEPTCELLAAHLIAAGVTCSAESDQQVLAAPLDVERLARALHAASWGCETGPAQAADFIYHQGHAAEIAREYAALREDPTP